MTSQLRPALIALVLLLGLPLSAGCRMFGFPRGGTASEEPGDGIDIGLPPLSTLRDGGSLSPEGRAIESHLGR